MRICIFTTNPKNLYSGGRYLSLILAHSLARAGAEVSYVTNNLPMFHSDFEDYDAVAPIAQVVHPDLEVPNDLESDWVVVIPTGSFDDRFYSAALDAARRWRARVTLLSFETPNWFNRVSPHTRSPMPTQSWRLVVAQGGAVITIAKAGIEPAKEFYGSARKNLFFDHWHPPVNDLAAAQAQLIGDGRKRVVCFVRTQDPHKGAADLLRVDPAVLAGHTLSLVFGRGIETSYVAALSRHLAGTGAELELHDRISDREKFDLLASASLLLFPSYFEGYGYPPVEAAWMGVPTVAYDLPLLHETVPASTDFAPLGDIAAFSTAIARSLAATRDGEPDRVAVRGMLGIAPDTLSAGRSFLQSLRQAERTVAPLPAQPPKHMLLTQPDRRLRDPMARAQMELREGDLHLGDLRVRMNGQRLTVAAEVSGVTRHRRLRFHMAGADIPDVRLSGKDGIDRFEVSGTVETWPGDGIEAHLTIQVIEQGGKLTHKANVPVRISPELLFLRDPSREISEGGPEALLWLPVAEMLRAPDVALAAAVVAQALHCAGIQTVLMPTNGLPKIPSDLDPEFLPLVDRLAEPKGDGKGNDRVAAVLHRLAAGDLVIARYEDARALEPLLPSGAQIRLFSDSRECVPCLALLCMTRPLKGEAALLADTFNVDTLRRARRSAVRRATDGSVILLSSTAPVARLSPPLLKVLGAVQVQLAWVRVLMPKRLAPEGLDTTRFGIEGHIELHSDQALSYLVAQAGRVAGMILDDRSVGEGEPKSASGDSSRSYLGDLKADVGLVTLGADPAAWVHAPTTDEGIAATTEALIAALRPVPASFEVLCRKLCMLPARVRNGEGAINMPAVPSSRPVPMPPPLVCPLPWLTRVTELTFSAPSYDHLPCLMEGWNVVDVCGAALTRNVGVVGFRADRADRAAAHSLSLLLRVENPVDEIVEVRLNGRLLGRAKPKNAGSASYSFALQSKISRDAWNGDSVQYLTIHCVHAANVSLMCIAFEYPTPDQPDWAKLGTVPGGADAQAADTPPAPVRRLPLTAVELNAAALQRGVRMGPGWGAQEPGGYWSVQATAGIAFETPVKGTAPAIFSLEGAAFRFGPSAAQRVGVLQGTGKRAEFIVSSKGLGRIPRTYDTAFSAADMERGISSVVFDFPDRTSPKELGASEDGRALGFFATGLRWRHMQSRCTTLSLDPGSFDGRRIAVNAAPGVLRLIGSGPVPADTVFCLSVGADSTGEDAPMSGHCSVGVGNVAWPRRLDQDSWEVCLPLAEVAATRPLHLRALRSLATGIWPNSAHAPTAPLVLKRLEIWTDAVNVGHIFATTLSLGLAPRMDDIRHILPLLGDGFPVLARLELAPNRRDVSALGAGWSSPEAGWVWNNGTQAELKLPHGAARLHMLCLIDAGTYLPNGLTGQRQKVQFGSPSPVASLMNTWSGTHRFAVPLVASQDPAQSVRFLFPEAQSPSLLGVGKDDRLLSLQMVAARFLAVAPAVTPFVPQVTWYRPSATGVSVVSAEDQVGWRFEILGSAADGLVAELRGTGVPPYGLCLAAVPEIVMHPLPMTLPTTLPLAIRPQSLPIRLGAAMPGQGDTVWRVLLFLPADDTGQIRQTIQRIHAAAEDGVSQPSQSGLPEPVCTVTLSAADIPLRFDI